MHKLMIVAVLLVAACSEPQAEPPVRLWTPMGPDSADVPVVDYVCSPAGEFSVTYTREGEQTRTLPTGDECDYAQYLASLEADRR